MLCELLVALAAGVACLPLIVWHVLAASGAPGATSADANGVLVALLLGIMLLAGALAFVVRAFCELGYRWMWVLAERRAHDE